MRYFMICNNGTIECAGKGNSGTEITEAEYNNILNIIRNKPTAESGYDYRLKADLTWELYELPPMPEEDEEITLDDALAKLRELGVDV